MNGVRRVRSVPILMFVVLMVMMLFPVASMAAQPTVNLGTTSTFAILAGETITNTGPTVINGTAGGDVGVHPGNTFPGQGDATISGAVHLGDAVALQAKNDLVVAYNDAAGRTPVTTIPTELGGTTLLPGVYDSSSGTFQITGTLTLDAQGDPDAVFIFLTDTTLVTASNSDVDLINSARFCRVFWKVGSSATLGTDSDFAGHIFALTSIQALNGASVEGQLLARNGSVTLENNVISNGLCAQANFPEIAVAKTADPTALDSDGGEVTYTYTVTNPGNVPLSNVTVTDDKLSSITYVSGDTNNDDLLDPGETWIYTATATLDETTTNTATATGTSFDSTFTDTDSVTVTVGGTPVGSTVSGGRLPDTATPWYNVLFAGFVLAIIGAIAVWRTASR